MADDDTESLKHAVARVRDELEQLALRRRSLVAEVVEPVANRLKETEAEIEELIVRSQVLMLELDGLERAAVAANEELQALYGTVRP